MVMLIFDMDVSVCMPICMAYVVYMYCIHVVKKLVIACVVYFTALHRVNLIFIDMH